MSADAVLDRIETFNRHHGGGVVVRKLARGYSLFSERTGAPLARLRPTGDGEVASANWWKLAGGVIS